MASTADNIHSAILLLGMVVIFNWMVSTNAVLLHAMAVGIIWVFGYYGFVKLLPESMQP